MKYTYIFTALIMSLLWTSCSQQIIPNGASVVENLDVDRYLGKWYEIARFDFRFEKDLSNVTAEYSLRPDGKIKVKNRGYNTVKNKWKEAIGKAKFREAQDKGALQVSFFGPFYAAYNIVDLVGDYEYALVFGQNTDYIWFLSRKPTMPEHIKKRFLTKAKQFGYNTDNLIWTEHE